MSGVEVEGLMTMGPNTTDINLITEAFYKTKKLFDDIKKTDKANITTLSMGMSGDYKIAIREGSTSIRLGTAIFGPRE